MEYQRFDTATLKAIKTDEGFLIDSPVIGRVGVQTYMDADGKIRKEFRPPDEVFNADSLATFKGKPLTNGHPKDGVNAANFKKLAIGTILSEGKQDGDFVRADIIIHDAEAIAAAEKGGIRELSLGYTVVLDEVAGEYNGEAYQYVQRNVKINHLALVPRARAGKAARLNLDAGDAHQITEDYMSEKLSRVRLDNGIEYDAAPEVAHALAQMRDDASTLKTQAEAHKAEADKLAGERDTLKARVDGFQAEIDKVKADAMDAAREEVKARAELEKKAESMKVDHAGKTDREVKELVIKTARADADLTGKSDEYVNAAFDMAISFKADAAMANQRKTVMNSDGAGTVKTAAQKYAEYKQSLSKGA